MKAIEESEIKNKNLLLAIGARSLNEVAKYYLRYEANVFARVIATPDSILNALTSCLDNSHIAILNPTRIDDDDDDDDKVDKILEYYLCRYWKIDCILCRDSGGYSQKLWEKISFKYNLKLFLLKRPEVKKDLFTFTRIDDLVKSVTNI